MGTLWIFEASWGFWAKPLGGQAETILSHDQAFKLRGKLPALWRLAFARRPRSPRGRIRAPRTAELSRLVHAPGILAGAAH